MRVSYVIISRNRCQRLVETLQRLIQNTPLQRSSWEAIVVDNGSTDETVATMRRDFPWVSLVALPENEGMPARNHAFAIAKGRYLVLLDDDSYPTREALPAVLNYMSHRPRVAAVVARAVLPDGHFEATAFPAVMLGGASILRRSVIDEVGGFAPEFFRQAEEYDLSFRIWAAGYQIERFEDVLFRHDKAPGGRSSAQTFKMDLRNNLILVERYLPADLRRHYRRDWMRRYASIARYAGHSEAVDSAVREARIWARREAAVGRKTLDAATVEKIFDLNRQAQLISDWATANAVRRVAIADLSKNIFATWRACTRARLKVLSIADDRANFNGLKYRNVPVLSSADAVADNPDGIVLSTINPAQIDERYHWLRANFSGPVLRLWEGKYLHVNAPQTHAA